MTAATIHPGDEARYADSRQQSVVLESDIMACVYLRGRTWWAHIRDETGDRKAVSLRIRGKENKVEAVKAANALEYRCGLMENGYITGADVEIQRRSELRILPLADEFIDTLRSQYTADNTRRALHGLIEHAKLKTAGAFGNRMIVPLINKYIKTITGVQHRRQMQYLRAIKNFGQWLEDECYINATEARRVRIQPSDDPQIIEHRSFDPWEAALLFTVPERGLWYETRVFMGLRGAEQKRLHDSHIVRIAHVPCLRVLTSTSKTKYEAILPIPERLVARLTTITGPLFAGISSRKETRQNWLLKDCLRLGISPDNVNDRSFRMTHTTIAQNAGISDSTSAQLRRDYGKGSQKLRLRNYSDQLRRLPEMCAANVQIDKYFNRQCATIALRVQDAN